MDPRPSALLALSVAGAFLVGACAGPTAAPDSTTSPVTHAVTTSTAVAIDPRVAAWAEDMRALQEDVQRVHPDPFWRQPEAEFDEWLAAAPEYLASLAEGDATAEVMRLTARIDGHTGVYPPEVGFHLYGLHLYDFDGDIDVIGAEDPSLIGATVQRIGDASIAEAIAAVTPYASYDNASTILDVVPMLLVTPEVLHAAGVVEDVAAPQFVLRLADGSERTLDPEQFTWAEYGTRVDTSPIGLAMRAAPPSLARIDEPFWTEVMGPTMYLQYNSVVSHSDTITLAEIAQRIDAALTSGEVDRLVVDLRYNPGGNDRTYAPLLTVLTDNPALERRGSLVVIIGRQTFSAAVLFATDLDHMTGVVFVGESTGGRPNLYGSVRPQTLPNSRIVVEVASKYYEFGGPDDVRDSIQPDVPATQTLADLLAGADPVLEVALQLP